MIDSFFQVLVQPVTLIVFVLLTTLLIFWISLIFFKTREIINSIEKSIKALNIIRESIDKGSYENYSELSFPLLDQIENSLPDINHIKIQWQEFRESFVIKEKGIYNTEQVKEFFDTEALLNNITIKEPLRLPFSFSFPLVHTFPGLATGAGILGTFIGISLGLATLGSEIKNSEIKALIPDLLTDISGAFLTSIMGIIVSIFINFFSRKYEDRLIASFHQLQEEIDLLVPRKKAETILDESQNLLGQILEENRNSREFLQELANELVDNLGKRIDESLTRNLSEKLESIINKVQNQVIEITKNSEGSARRFAEGVTKQISDTLGNSIASMEETIKEAAKNFGQIADQFEILFQKAKETTEHQNKAIEESFNILEKGMEKTKELGEQMAALENVTMSYLANFEKISTQQANLARLSENQSTLQNATEQNITELSSVLNEFSKNYNEIGESMGKTLAEIGSNVKNLHESVLSMTSQTSKASDSVSAASLNLNKRLDEEKVLITKYESISALFEDAMESGKPLVKGLTQSSQSLEEASKYMKIHQETSKNFNLTLGKTLNDMTTHAKNVGSALENNKNTLSETTKNLTQMERTIKSYEQELNGQMDLWRRGVEQDLEKFGGKLSDSLKRTLEDYDRNLKEAVGYLSKSMQELQDITDDIIDKSK